MNDGLIAYWPFDEDALDEIGNHNATVHGNTFFVSGRIDQAAVFDGSGDYIKIDPNFNNELMGSPFTVAAWWFPNRTWRR